MQQKLRKNGFVLVILLVLLGLTVPSQGEAAAGVIVDKYEYKTGKYDMEYPHFDGMTNTKAQENMNAFIQQMVDNFISGNNRDYVTTAKMSYKVHLNESDKVSVSILTYNYSGGAHGMSGLAGYTFDLKTGNRYSFNELFNIDYDGRQKINRLILNQIRERNINIFEPFKGVSDTPNFYLEEGRKVVIVFGHYEIAPYAAGILKFPLAY